MSHKRTGAIRVIFRLFLLMVMLGLLASPLGTVGAQETPPGETQVEVVSPYLTILRQFAADGNELEGYVINGPSKPPAEFAEEHAANAIQGEVEGTIANFPAYTWVFGCSAVSGAMIAAYYDRGSYPNMYSGPTNGGVMPLNNASWPTWSDGFETYPNNPLIASHINVDGRTTKGSIDDYWVTYGSSTQDPYITGAWSQHAWSDSIGDYMKTSQSAYENTDGSTTFFNYTAIPDKLYCDVIVENGITKDGTVGRRLFYQARGFTVTDCYNQRTDNNGGGFTLANYKAEIDAGHPVLLNLAGHSVVGFGYSGSTVYIRDTWDTATHEFPWGGNYSGMNLLSVSIVKLAAGPAPLTQYVYLPLITRPVPNQAPNNISLSNSSIPENQPINTVVGTLSTTDPDAGNTFTYTLVAGTGSADNGSFNISGAQLRTSAVFDYEVKNSYNIRIRVTDQGGLTFEKAFVISVTQVGANPFLNPGFEQGHVAWTEYSWLGFDLITEASEDTITAHSGSWFAWLGGANSESSELSQVITISASTPYLHYWYWVGSQDVCGYDFFAINVNGTQVAEFTLCSSNNTNGWVQGVVNLAAYAGSGRTILFEVNNDGSNNSNLFLDDVSMSASASTTTLPEAEEGFDPTAISAPRILMP
ncbi:MAG TPA: cadherin repeat domain-containing protein [Anaerolineaceae bacterium]|nr:cadherin repeat domain-containing protein [Anaerolineaceae bacterium]